MDYTELIMRLNSEARKLRGIGASYAACLMEEAARVIFSNLIPPSDSESQ